MANRDANDPKRDDDYNPPPVIEPGQTFASVTEQDHRDRPHAAPSVELVLRRCSSASTCAWSCLMAITWLLIKGTGIWGVNIPIGWGFEIINFVWWIGIGHAGTLISAILLLLNRTGARRSTGSPKR